MDVVDVTKLMEFLLVVRVVRIVKAGEIMQMIILRSAMHYPTTERAAMGARMVVLRVGAYMAVQRKRRNSYQHHLTMAMDQAHGVRGHGGGPIWSGDRWFIHGIF